MCPTLPGPFSLLPNLIIPHSLTHSLSFLVPSEQERHSKAHILWTASVYDCYRCKVISVLPFSGATRRNDCPHRCHGRWMQQAFSSFKQTSEHQMSWPWKLYDFSVIKVNNSVFDSCACVSPQNIISEVADAWLNQRALIKVATIKLEEAESREHNSSKLHVMDD